MHYRQTISAESRIVSSGLSVQSLFDGISLVAEVMTKNEMYVQFNKNENQHSDRSKRNENDFYPFISCQRCLHQCAFFSFAISVQNYVQICESADTGERMKRNLDEWPIEGG